MELSGFNKLLIHKIMIIMIFVARFSSKSYTKLGRKINSYELRFVLNRFICLNKIIRISEKK